MRAPRSEFFLYTMCTFTIVRAFVGLDLILSACDLDYECEVLILCKALLHFMEMNYTDSKNPC